MKKIFLYYKYHKKNSLLRKTVLAVLLLQQTIYSQEIQVPDSLKKYSYKELFEKQNLHIDDTLKSKVYAIAYLLKAKKEKDTIEIAEGYNALVGYYLENSKSILYLDSIINLTQNIENKKYPGSGYLWKGVIQYTNGKYKSALENLIKAQNYAIRFNNVEQIISIKNSIGSIKLIWGNYIDAKKEFTTVIKAFDSLKISKNYSLIQQNSFYYLSHLYTKEKIFDSAYYFANKYYAFGKIELQNEIELEFKELSAEIEFYKKNYTKTIKLLNEVGLHKEYSNTFNFNYLYGSSLYKSNKLEKAFQYFKKADSIYTATQDLMPEVRQVQEFFIDYYKNKKDTKNQLKHIDKLFYVDSIIDYNVRVLNEITIKKYDTPILLAKKEKIIQRLNLKQQYYVKLALILGVLILLAIFFIYRFYKKHMHSKERFETLISKQSEKKISGVKSISKVEGIPNEVIKSILIKLKAFENSKDYLNNELTLNSLAKQLETNANYLSKVINHYKSQNYSNYIAHLRINYCIQKIKSNSNFRKYTIQAIAYESGFKSAESFSKSFHKKAGVYPSYFIKDYIKKMN